MKDILEYLMKAAIAIAPQVEAGVAKAVEAGKSIISAIDAAKEIGEPADQAKLDQAVNDLQDRINAHADRTIGGLRGQN